MPTLPPLPHASLGRLMGLIEAMKRTPEPDSISSLAQSLLLGLEDLIPLVRAAELLDWARVEGGHYDLTEEGVRVADGDHAERQRLFRARALQVPLLKTILEQIRGACGQPVPREEILALLEDQFPRIEAERQLATAVNWGRYAELLDYDAEEEVLSLGSFGG